MTRNLFFVLINFELRLAKYDSGEWIEAWDQIENYLLFYGNDFPENFDYEVVKPVVEGKGFTFHLSLMVNGSVKNYDFKFKVNEVTKSVSAENPFKDAMNQDNSMKLEVGAKVKGNWKGQGIYYHGTIKEVKG